MTHTGSCLCGGVRYQLESAIESIGLCHCAQCRKASGSAFLAVAAVPAAALRITAGEDLLRAYSATPGKRRLFCGECGSPLYSERDARPGERRLRVGTLDTPLDGVTAAHAFADSKADWWEITDSWPRYAGFVR